MPDPVVPRTEIELSESGSYHVTEQQLVMLDRTRFDQISLMMSSLMAANPTYEFMQKEDYLHGGFHIYWRRRKHHG